jgi:integrase
LSYARKWEPVGNDPKEAHKALQRKRGELQTKANGGTVVEAESNVPKTSVKSSFEAWLDDFRDRNAHDDTLDAKTLVSVEFQRSCKTKALADITRKDCLTYVNAWLIKRGNEDRTRFNKFLHLRQWLQFHGIKTLLTTKDAPPYEVADPVALEDEELEVFWKYCPIHKRLLYTVLLCAGLRLQEIQTLRWVDIIWREKCIRIQKRPEWEYTPKKHHMRDIQLSDDLLQALRDAKLLAKFPLVFHTRSGRPLTHLWDDTQALFRKAKLPMEKGHPHCFRATFCTTLLRQNVPIPDVMHLMGHKDIQSTMRYMAILNKAKRWQVVNNVKFVLAA